MAYPEDVQRRKQRAIMNAEVADIYQRYVFNLLKAEQAALDEFTEQMIEIHAQMEASKEKLEEIISRHIDEGDLREVASVIRELSYLYFAVCVLTAGWLELFQAREAAEKRIRDLEWERNQITKAVRTNIEYAQMVE